MPSRLLAVSGLVALLATTTPLIVRAQTGTPAPVTPAPVRQARQRREKHPALMQALKALQRAKGALERGAQDFGGHRVKALDLTDQAIKEINAALAYDKN